MIPGAVCTRNATERAPGTIAWHPEGTDPTLYSQSHHPRPRRAGSCAFCCLWLCTSPLTLSPVGNTLGCNLSRPRAPFHRPPCTNRPALAATRLIPESQCEGRGLAVDTPGIFHIAIQLPGTLARGPGSTTTWQDYRIVGEMDSAPQHAPPTLLLAARL